MDSQIKDANYALLEGDRDGVITILGERQDMVETIWLRAHSSPDDTERNFLLHQVSAHQDSVYAPLAADILQREQNYTRQIETPPGWQFWKRPRWQPFTRFVSRYRIVVIILLVALCAGSIFGLTWCTGQQKQTTALSAYLTETQQASALPASYIESTAVAPSPTSTLQPTPSFTPIPQANRSSATYPAGRVSLAFIEYPTNRLVTFQSYDSEAYATPVAGAVFAAFQLEFTCGLAMCNQPPEAIVSLRLNNNEIIDYQQNTPPLLANEPIIDRASADPVNIWFVFEFSSQNTPVALVLEPCDGSQAIELPIRP